MVYRAISTRRYTPLTCVDAPSSRSDRTVSADVSLRRPDRQSPKAADQVASVRHTEITWYANTVRPTELRIESVDLRGNEPFGAVTKIDCQRIVKHRAIAASSVL